MTVPGGASDHPSAGRADPADPEGADGTRNAADEPAVVTPPKVDKATLDRIFGTVLPDVTRDELPDRADRRGSDDWYRENRPPHHGG